MIVSPPLLYHRSYCAKFAFIDMPLHSRRRRVAPLFVVTRGIHSVADLDSSIEDRFQNEDYVRADQDYTDGSKKDDERLHFVKKIQEGSFGCREKWVAFDKKQRRKVILEKLEKTELTTARSCRIKSEDFREAILHRCARKHPGIIYCNGLVKDNLSHIYLSVEYLQVKSLETLMKSNVDDGFRVNFVQKVFEQLGGAIEHLHWLQIVHCAITPSNVSIYCNYTINEKESDRDNNILRSDLSGLRVKLGNFKLSRTVGDKISFFRDNSSKYEHFWLFSSIENTAKEMGKISVALVPPSDTTCTHKILLLDDTAKPSFDVWCFGAMLFLCLTGQFHWNCQCNNAVIRSENTKNRKNIELQNSQYSCTKHEYLKSSRHVGRQFDKTRNGRGAVWKSLKSPLTKLMETILSPMPDDRPTIHNVLRHPAFALKRKWMKT
ncbi:uncharacterized protein LOC120348193 isoform X1 [Styela clava]